MVGIEGIAQGANRDARGVGVPGAGVAAVTQTVAVGVAARVVADEGAAVVHVRGAVAVEVAGGAAVVAVGGADVTGVAATIPVEVVLRRLPVEDGVEDV